MAGSIARAAIVGATTLLGKELADELNSAGATVWDLTLLEAGEPGQVTSAGDEAMVIQALEPGAFQGIDVVFFAGDADSTRAHWAEAAGAGASIVDCTGALERETVALVRAPWIEGGGVANLTTKALIPAHPAAVMLALAATRLRARWADARLVATVLEPASQQGSAGLDEMHGQTVALLSFQPLPMELYDTQVAFNLSAALGSAGKADLHAIAARVRRDLTAIAGEPAAAATVVQLLQAPVFHGYAASIYVELGASADVAEVEKSLRGGIVSAAGEDDASPSNVSAAEQGQVLMSVRADADGFWLWIAADNLRLAAQNAAACAAELLALRPVGKVQ